MNLIIVQHILIKLRILVHKICRVVPPLMASNGAVSAAILLVPLTAKLPSKLEVRVAETVPILTVK
jgi:hypothetical protein